MERDTALTLVLLLPLPRLPPAQLGWAGFFQTRGRSPKWGRGGGAHPTPWPQLPGLLLVQTPFLL